ncbi:pyrroline-5-carboxylate reductase [Bacteroidota bacterium]
MKVLVIGAGNMGLTYAEGMSKSSLLKNEPIMITDKSEEKLQELNKLPYFKTFNNLDKCAPQADIIFIAVKPFHSESVFEELKPYFNQHQIIVSVMAGVTIDTIKANTGLTKVVRSMPNLPAKIGEGLTTFVASSEVNKEELTIVETLLATTGKSIEVADENFIDASTGISGSGPAYVFYFMQSMMEAAEKMGFSKETATVLVSQTFKGAVELFNQSSISPSQWMDMVASKGGTTQAALDSLNNDNVNKHIKNAAFAAFNRAVELGKNH